MIVNRSNSRISGKPSTRLSLRLGSSLGGSLYFAMLAMPISAQAQNECGTPPIGGGTVTCSAADNTDMGVVYTAQPQDLTVVLEDDVAVQTTTLSTPGVLINGTGNFAVSGPNATVSTSGDSSYGVDVSSSVGSADVVIGDVTTSGALSTGVRANGSGAGNVSVTTNNVSTAGLSSSGVEATADAGNVSVSTGAVTTIGDLANAINAFSAGGDVAISISGAVSTTGAAADAVVATGGDNASVNIASGGTVHATDGNLITISSVNGSTVNNAGVIAEDSGGYAIQAFGGPLVINNSGDLSSDIVLTPGDDSINNSGTFIIGSNPDFGAGNDVFANSGTVMLASGAVMPVSATLTGLETFNNSGLIDLRNNVAGDQLTMPGTYSGSGASQLGLDVNLSNGTTISTSDALVVGGAATGSTDVLVNTNGNSVFTSGVTIVQAGAGSSADAFSVAPESINSGLVRYQVNYDPTNSSYSLVGGPNDTAFRTLNYAEGARNLWLKSADVVSAQLRARRDALWAFGGGSPSARTWVQIHGSVEKRDGARDVTLLGQTRSIDTGFKQDYFGGQVGVDLGGSSGDRGGFAFGVTGGYISSAMKFANSPDSVNFSSVNGGVYGAYTSGNFFVNALGKYDYYWADVTGRTGGFHKNQKGASYGARGEVGMRFGSDSFFVEPAASISYVHTKFDDFSVMGTTVDFDSDNGLRGRFGGRVGGQFALGNGPIMAVYAGGNYIHEFQGKDQVTFSGGGQSFTYRNRKIRDYGEAVLGVTIGQDERVSGFLEANYIRSFNSNGGNSGIEGAGGRAGLRFRF